MLYITIQFISDVLSRECHSLLVHKDIHDISFHVDMYTWVVHKWWTTSNNRRNIERKKLSSLWRTIVLVVWHKNEIPRNKIKYNEWATISSIDKKRQWISCSIWESWKRKENKICPHCFIILQGHASLMSSQKHKQKLVWAVECCCNRFRFECIALKRWLSFWGFSLFPFSGSFVEHWWWYILVVFYEMHHKYILFLLLLLLSFPFATMTRQILFECNLIWCHMNVQTFFYFSLFNSS